MAQTNFTPISLYHTNTPGLAPDSANLVSGELALNIPDGKLYFKDGDENIVLLASKATSSNVTSVSVVSANGFAGSVANPTTTPAITLSTSATGVLKGSSGSIIAASPGVDYAPATTGSSILYADGSGGFSSVTIGSNLTFIGGTLSATGGGSSGVTSFNTRTGAVSLLSADVTNALGYTPPTGSGVGASGTWGINISGNASTASSASYASSAGSANTANSATTASTATTATNVSGTVALANGGTGATTAANARTNLGLGTAAVANTTAFLSSSTTNNNVPELYFGGTSSTAPVGIGSSGVRLGGTTTFIGGSAGSIGLTTDISHVFGFYNTGIAYAPVGGAWQVSSDGRIKENITPIVGGLSTVMQLNPVKYSFKRHKLQTSNKYGLIAQELEQIVPEVVSTSTITEDGIENVKGVSYTELVPILIKAIQELKAEVDALKAAK